MTISRLNFGRVARFYLRIARPRPADVPRGGASARVVIYRRSDLQELHNGYHPWADIVQTNAISFNPFYVPNQVVTRDVDTFADLALFEVVEVNGCKILCVFSGGIGQLAH